METIATLNAINAALALAEVLLPKLQALVLSGEITPEQQAGVRASYESLKAQADGQFQGPEWQVG